MEMSATRLRHVIATPQEAEAFRILQFDAVEPDREQIYRLVGLKPDRPNHQRWIGDVETLVADLRRLLRPRGMYRIDPVQRMERTLLELGSGAVFEGAVSTFLAHSTHVATFIVTIGSAVERLARDWMQAGKVMQGTIADAIASESVEAVAEKLQAEVRHWAHQRGAEITPRYSPGYCGMDVRQQTTLFASLPAHQIEVTRTPSCLMVPLKSVSGLIGIGPADQVSPGGYPCETCNHDHCMQRRAPFNPRRGSCTDWAACPPDPHPTDAA